MAPTVTVTKGTVTTSSIQVSVNAEDEQSGMPSNPIYNYYIKASTDSDYPEEPSYTGSEASHIFKGLKQDTSYDIKVTVADSAGNIGEGKSTGITTTTVAGATDGLQTGSITASPVTWSNGKASVTLSTSTSFMIQYKVGIDGTWAPANYSSEKAGADATVTDLSHNDIVYARLIDDAGNTGSVASVTIIDGTKPTVTVTKGTATTSSIQVSVSSSDSESGMPESPTYSYYIKKSTDEEYPSSPTRTTTDTSYTFKGLTHNTSYDVKVTVADNAGNIGEGKSTGISTETVAGATDGLQTGNITVSPVVWNDGSASITLSTSTTFTIQYKVGSDGTWTPASYSDDTAGIDVKVTDLSHNDIVYARLIDDAGNTGSQASVTILDEIAPTVTVTKGIVTTSSIEVTVGSVDNQSGMPESPTYNYYIKKSTDGDYPEKPTHTTTDTSYTFTGLTHNTSYDVKVTVADKAGNTGEGKITGISTETVAGATEGLQTGNITVSPVVWNDGSASITLSTSTTFTIQYKVGSDGTWKPASYSNDTAGVNVTVTGLAHNDIVYARLIDDAGNTGSQASVTILDEIEPTVTVTKGTVTTSSIQVSVSSSDGQSGMPASPTYNYYIKKSTDGDYPTSPTLTTTDTSYTFTGLTHNTSYDVKVTVADNAGNIGEGTSTGIKTATVAGATDGLQTGNITVGPVTWSNGSASITLSTNTNFMIQYKVGSSGAWTPASYSSGSAGKDVTVTGLAHNSIVYARLIDDAGNTGSQASVTIIDGTAPTVNSLTVTGYDTTSISVSASATDNQSGIYSYQFQYKLSTASSYTTAKTTVTSNTTCTYKYTGLADDTTYNLRVIVTDKAGLTNDKTATQKTVDANVAPVLASAAFNSKTTNKITVTARATDENGDTLTYKLYTSTSQNGTYSQKATTSASQNSTVTLNATGLSQYTTYWWYVQVSDGEETITSSKQSVRTYCPGTGYTCYTSSCSGTRTTTCTTCDGEGETREYCSGGSSSRCSYCDGSGTVQEYCPGGSSSSSTCPTCRGTGRYSCAATTPTYNSRVSSTRCPECGGSASAIYWVCNDCGGSGSPDINCPNCGLVSRGNYSHVSSTCSTCRGSGRVTTSSPCQHGYTSSHYYYDTCYRCNGWGTIDYSCEHGYTSGHYYYDTCSRCNGRGTITTTPCTHGYSSSHRYCTHYTNTTKTSHSYCSHGNTSQHD